MAFGASERLASAAGLVVAAWGNDGGFLERSKAVRGHLGALHVLKLNRSGEPAHPLYQPARAEPIPWAPP